MNLVSVDKFLGPLSVVLNFVQSVISILLCSHHYLCVSTIKLVSHGHKKEDFLEAYFFFLAALFDHNVWLTRPFLGVATIAQQFQSGLMDHVLLIKKGPGSSCTSQIQGPNFIRAPPPPTWISLQRFCRCPHFQVQMMQYSCVAKLGSGVPE